LPINPENSEKFNSLTEYEKNDYVSNAIKSLREKEAQRQIEQQQERKQDEHLFKWFNFLS
jgi:hypothetical protein